MNTFNNTIKKIQRYEKKWNNQLNHFSIFQKMEQITKIPKVYLAIILSLITFLLLFFNVASQLITNLIAWIYPAYASLQTIENDSYSKRQQWITYWVILTGFHFIEYFEDTLLYWLPFYYLFKTIFILYLILPAFKGAIQIHSKFFQNKFTKPKTEKGKEVMKNIATGSKKS
ncbi:TB2/DP1, HVA22 family-domain-containing protein [Cunninghamella echinulata]|nr:TB2/DP1, HVA22 family-domain-containing protein [Cunninghamella echinulata]